jgi:UDP-N-acetylglucosamine--N-acetylmuramyl-(pentapeptide) pyrophosphoryl-undecaprenol N-acetylglucosamine transferase
VTLRVLAASGDSVGHLNHAFVVLDRLAVRHALEPGVVIARDSAFRGLVESRGFPVHTVGETAGIRRELDARLLLRHLHTLAAGTLGAILEARALLDSFRPDLVVGTGGRCSFPVTLVAALRGIPTVTVPHYDLRRTNQALALVVDRTCLARAEDRSRFPRLLRRRLVVTGTPVRPEAFARASRAEARRALGLHPDRPVVACVGYSRGSRSFSRLAQEVLPRARTRRGVQTVLQYGGFPPSDPGAWDLAAPFFDDVLQVFAAADVVVSAGGETTMLELCAVGAASVCITLPDTPIGPHLGVLARDLKARGATVFLGEPTPASLAEALDSLLTDGVRRASVAAAARAVLDPAAPDRIVAAIEVLLAERARRTGRARGTAAPAGSGA